MLWQTWNIALSKQMVAKPTHRCVGNNWKPEHQEQRHETIILPSIDEEINSHGNVPVRSTQSTTQTESATTDLQVKLLNHWATAVNFLSLWWQIRRPKINDMDYETPRCHFEAVPSRSRPEDAKTMSTS